jgi:YesN/AraC family two-component response regulator
VYQFYKRKVYKKKFLDIIHNKQHIKKTDFVSSIENIDIQEEIIAGVLERLKDFEVNNKFLDKKITLNSLAKDFKTNSNYLSKIINHHKETSFSNYINNLKIEFIISEIKRKPILKKYTIKAIANEAYFNNAESFSKAFYKLKGIKPSFFMQELEKREQKI